jgi:NAD-dependent dihydropyrimidine dehydrogenase PreA subunit
MGRRSNRRGGLTHGWGRGRGAGCGRGVGSGRHPWQAAGVATTAPARVAQPVPLSRCHPGTSVAPFAGGVFAIAVVDQKRCTACGACASACPAGAIAVGDVATVDAAVCIGCGGCVPGCPNDALTLAASPSIGG